MRYISSDEKKFMLQVQASIYNQMENFALVEKKYAMGEQGEKVMYDCYELNEEEAKHDFKTETLESFTETYIEGRDPAESHVTSVEIFQGGESVTEISRLIDVLVFEPEKPAYVQKIHRARTAYKEIVEGDVEYLVLGGEYILVCNEVGMLINLPHNRGYYGTFLITKNVDGYCDSLTSEDIEILRKELDEKENFESKSKYLQEYFQNNRFERQLFEYRLKNNVHYIATESIVEFLLAQQEDELKRIEQEIQAIERGEGELLNYLKRIGKQMSEKENGVW